ncbi:peptide chain release factor PrfB3, chloroplastic isoform X1 [Lolium rigidum]|uniref:peptide chain release factor PrfB3, chloroplastic isoform X1 n=1 Tax=Lolium rigidum TaxID=89674 RepID=UPI001F5D5A1C|nr:peptide chain release factor PrfB3, chloroplastic isoform X1 [Lolium rigidum]
MATAASPPAGPAASSRASATRSRAGRLSLPAALPADGRGDSATTYKELGLYSWKRRIEDAVIRVEMTASNALKWEEAQRIKHEEVLQSRSLWDNPAKSHEALSALSDAIRAVDHLKDLLYKAEEAKLISQLAGMDVINGELFKQAYNISLDASEFLDRYEMYKLLKGPYDKEGACIIVTAGSEGVASELWTEKLFGMYTCWARRQGCKQGLIEQIASTSGNIQFAAMEIESEYMFGILSGEKGMHTMINSSIENSGTEEAISARVDIIPLFLDRPLNFHLDDNDLEISPSLSECGNPGRRNGATVRVQHIPSGVTAESSGERSYFANKLKAMSRLKAKLLVITTELGAPGTKMINIQAVEERYYRETRRYTFGPQELVHDLNTGIQLSDLNSVLEGDIEPFIRGRIISRHG